MYYIVGLGNPGEEYEGTRHNTGREAVEKFKDSKMEDGKIGKKIKIIESEEYMNNSGKAVGKIIKSKKAAENLIVVHDDLDLPLGTMKISFNKGVGGHRGLNSVAKAIKTLQFTRVRIGISPSTPSGKIKKPGAGLSPKTAEKAVIDFILGKFKPKETEILKKVWKRASEAIETIVTEGRDKAMNLYNS